MADSAKVEFGCQVRAGMSRQSTARLAESPNGEALRRWLAMPTPVTIEGPRVDCVEGEAVGRYVARTQPAHTNRVGRSYMARVARGCAWRMASRSCLRATATSRFSPSW
jgi:hypothetical protein